MRHLNPQNTILDEVWQVEPWKTAGDMRAYLGRFLFSGDEVFQTVGTLSGGEKSRVALAKLMLSTANLLVLDEPTNHLDIPAREMLEQALVAYPGTLFIVSHDRYFLDCIISRLLYLRDGTCTSYAGNYTDYQARLTTQTTAPQPAPGVKKTPPVSPRLRPRLAKRRKPSVIEDEIHYIEAEIAAVQTAIETHNGTDWQRLTELSTQHGTLTARLESLLAEWEESMATEGS
jgi:ATP-binding cassette subfamily F protein 3